MTPPTSFVRRRKEVGVESGVPAGGKAPSYVTIELQPHPRGVLLILTHSRLAANDVPGTGAGWHTHLDILASKQPPDFARAVRKDIARTQA